MKKFALALLTVLLVAAVILLPVFATTTGGASASAVAGTPGETVTVTVSIHDLPEVKALAVNFVVPEGLTLVDDKAQSKWLLNGFGSVDFSKKTAAMMFMDAIDCTENTDIIQLSFIIDEPVGEALLAEEFSVEMTVQATDSQSQKTVLDTTAKITVSAPATGITLNKNELALDLSGTKEETLTATLTPAYTTDSVQWESSDETVVTVENGKITAVAQGTATITATAGDVSASCAVTVSCSHANAVETPAKKATCDEDGNNKYYKCDDCNQYLKADKATVTTKEAETLTKLGHNEVHHEEIKATCKAEGNVEYWSCDQCEKNYADEDCTQVLDVVKTEIDPTNHVGQTELRDAADASCFQAGYTGDTYCLDCGVKTATGNVIEATGNHVAAAAWKTNDTHHWHACTTAGCPQEMNKAEHNYQWKTDKEATEYESGLKHEECECGLKRNEDTVIPKLDHVHRDIQHHAAVAATCTKAGNREYWTCGSDLCEGKYYGDDKCQLQLETIVEAINPNNHAGGTEIKGYVAASCYQFGYSGDTYCVGCGVMTVPGFALNPTEDHKAAAAWQTNETHHWHACTTTGCTAEVGKAAHNYQWETDKPATEYETGLKHEECECGLKRNEGTVIPKLDHVHRDIQHHVAVAATCTKAGTVEYWTCGSDLCDGKYYGDEKCQLQLETIVEKINPNNHAGGTEVKDAVAANCYKPGYTGDTYCVGCGVKTVTGSVINPTGNHVAGTAWYTDDSNHWHVCTTDGCTAVVGKAAHSYQWVTDKEATEYVTGLKHEECECGLKRSEDTVIPKVPHVHRDIKHHAAVAATCVKAGTVEYWTCGSDLCDGKYYGDAQCKTQLTTIVESINPSNHVGATQLKGDLAPTCSETGYSGDTYCSSCDKLISKGAVIPATGNHTPGKDYVTNGTKHWKVCTHCEAVVGAEDHKLAWIVDSNPTEEVVGKKHQQCSVCKFVCNEGTEIEKLKHEPTLVKGKKNTCTEDGVADHFFCNNCGKYYASADGKVGAEIKAEDTILKATGHTYEKEWSTDGTNHWHECHCGDKADKAAHTGKVVGAVEATKNEAGYTGDTICSVCEYEMAKGEVIPSKQDAVVDNIENAETGSSIQIVVPNDDGSVDAKIPVEVLESAKGKDVELVLDMGKYQWKIFGNKIASAGAQALDMTVKLDLNKIPAEAIEKLAGDAPTQQLSFAHSGAFGFSANLEIELDQAYAGKTGNVYCYNANKELELVGSSTIGADGKIVLALDKADDYVIVVTENEPAPAPMSAIWWIVIAVAAVGVVVVVVVLVSKKKKNA